MFRVEIIYHDGSMEIRFYTVAELSLTFNGDTLRIDLVRDDESQEDIFVDGVAGASVKR